MNKICTKPIKQGYNPSITINALRLLMNQVVLQAKLGTRMEAPASPLCVLLSQLRQLRLAMGTASTLLLSLNPSLTVALCSRVAHNSSALVQAGHLTKDLPLPEPLFLQDLLIKALARQIIVTNVADEITAIKNWRQQQMRMLLTTQVAKKIGYPNAEMAGFAAVFCLLDSTQTRHVVVPQLWHDLHFTLYQPLNAQIDTALLSRLVWCCHQAVSNKLGVDSATSNAFLQLLGIAENTLQELFIETLQLLEQRSANVDITESLEVLEQGGNVAASWLAEQKLQIQQQIQQAYYLQSLQAPVLNDHETLKLQLHRVLLHYQLPVRYALFVAAQNSAVLQLMLREGCDLAEYEFAIPMMVGRNAIATCIHMEQISGLKIEDDELAPVDKQLLRLLNCDSLLCVPLTGPLSGVLVLPDAPASIEDASNLQEQVKVLLDIFHKHTQRSAASA
jgi:hypothetical protein